MKLVLNTNLSEILTVSCVFFGMYIVIGDKFFSHSRLKMSVRQSRSAGGTFNTELIPSYVAVLQSQLADCSLKLPKSFFPVHIEAIILALSVEML